MEEPVFKFQRGIPYNLDPNQKPPVRQSATVFFLANSWNYSASYLGVRCGGDLMHRVQPNQGRCLQRTYEALTADTFTFSHTGKIWFPCLIMGAKLVIVHYIFESNNYTHCLVSPITFRQPPCLEMHVRIHTGESFT